MVDENLNAATRSQARESGLRFYRTGKPCKHGHVGLRYAISGGCVECELEWHKLNPERDKANQKRSYQNCKEKKRAYRASRKEIMRAYQKEYQRKFRLRLNAKSRRWYWKNRDKVAAKYKTIYLEKSRANNRNRKAKKRNNGGSHTGQDVADIFKAQHGKCACCRIKLNKYHVDHIMPLAKGGSNYPANLQLLCAPCNLSKNARDPIEFMRSQGMLL